MPATNIEIVKLPPSEWEQYKQIRLEALQTDPQAFGSTYAGASQQPDSYWQERLRVAESEDQDFLMLFARQDGQIIGMTGAYFQNGIGRDETALIISVFVGRQYRGLGAGKLLMEAMLHKLQTLPNVKKARLEVNPAQTAALRLYQSCGFEKVGISNNPVGTGEQVDEWVMEKTLP